MKRTVKAQALPELACACATVRRAARLVTLLYARELAPRIEPAQYALLTALEHIPGCTQTTLGRVLGLDKTTLSRNLLVLKKTGWIEPGVTDDLRERGYRLTQLGEAELAASRPAWKRAQRKLRAAMKQGEWESTFAMLASLTEAARKAALQ